MTGKNRRFRRTAVAIACLAVICAAGCMDAFTETDTPAVNDTERAIAIALADPVVREEIPADTGEYEIVDVWPGTYEATGPEGTVSVTCLVVTLRPENITSRYLVFVDLDEGAVVAGHWQYIKEPFPGMATGPPEEYASMEAATTAPGPDCPLAALTGVPAGYGFSHVSVFGDPAPRREVVYVNRTDRIQLVQTCAGDPPWPFAISMPDQKTITVNGTPTTLVEGIGQNEIAWTAGGASYWLLGNIPPDDLARLASSVAPFAAPVFPEPTMSTEMKPGMGKYSTAEIYWPDTITVQAGTANSGEIVAESREKGYGEVRMRIISRVGQRVTASPVLPMPEGMGLTVEPSSFMTYPHETYYAQVLVQTTPATPPGKYIFRFQEQWEGSFYGEGWFEVVVTG